MRDSVESSKINCSSTAVCVCFNINRRHAQNSTEVVAKDIRDMVKEERRMVRNVKGQRQAVKMRHYRIRLRYALTGLETARESWKSSQSSGSSLCGRTYAG